MGRIQIMGLLALAAGLSLVGCGPFRGATLSPDTRHVAYNDDKSIVIHSFENERADRHIPLKDAGPPYYSPDWKWLVVPSTQKLYLLSAQGELLGFLPGVDLPLAWNPDSTEFVGFRDKTAVVVHVASRSIVRSYPLPIGSLEAVWLGPGRNMAFSSRDTVATVIDGHVHTTKLKTEAIHLAYDAHQDRLVLLEIGPIRRLLNNDLAPSIDIGSVIVDNPLPPIDGNASVNTADLKLTRGTELYSGAYMASSPSQIPGLAFSWIQSISPDGKHLVQVRGYDRSPHNLLKRVLLTEQQAQGAHRRSERDNLELEATRLAKGLKFWLEWSILTPGEVPLKAEVVHASYEEDHPMIAWSSDSRKVAFVMKNRTFMKNLGP